MGIEGIERRALRARLACGGYATPRHPRRSRADRLLGGCDAWYYLRLLQVVGSGWTHARRGGFDASAWMRHAWWTRDIVETCGGQIRVEGLEHVAALRVPAVFVCNHMSLLETFLLPGFLLPFGDLAIVVKRSLLRYPFFGIVLRSLNPIAVTRSKPRTDLKLVLKEGAETLSRGRSVLLFPQATRSREFDAAQFNSLGAKLASRVEAPVVPVALRTDFHGLGRVWKDLGRIHRSRPVRIRVGPAISETADARAAHAKAVDFIGAALREWNLEVRCA